MCKALPYVYRLDNHHTGEFYYGFRKANKVPAQDDIGIHYFTSSNYVKPRFSEFSVTIIAEFFDADSAFWFEQFCIKEHWTDSKSLNRKYINNAGKEIFCGTTNPTDEHKIKIGDALRGIPKTMEHRAASSAAQRGKVLSESHKLKLRKPKNLTEANKIAHEKLTNPDSMSKPRKCSCIVCHKQTSTNYINKHICSN